MATAASPAAPENTCDGDEWNIILSNFYLISLATATVLLGARRSVNTQLDVVFTDADTSPSINLSSALMLPIFASVWITVIYLLFNQLQSALVMLMTVVCAFSARFATWPCTSQLARCLRLRHLEEPLSWAFACAMACGWLGTGHWAFVDLLGVCACVTCIALVRLPNLKVGCVCLASLLAYDVIWVFGSSSLFGENVMLQVAHRPASNPARAMAAMVVGKETHRVPPQVQLPIKLLVPIRCSDGLFQLLGLGDIAIPGLIVALAARFDAFLASSLVRESPNALPTTGRRTMGPASDMLRRRRRIADDADTNAHVFLGRARESLKPGLSRYCAVVAVAYACGLAIASSTAAYLGAQPALIYLGPSTILCLFITAAASGRDHLPLLWRGFEEYNDDACLGDQPHSTSLVDDALDLPPSTSCTTISTASKLESEAANALIVTRRYSDDDAVHGTSHLGSTITIV